jgi:pimeloyl-ACP methyl ester carboxylesterase
VNTVTSNDGTTIAYEQSGSGPALILVGGALSDRKAATSIAALLAPHFTVYALDRRGRGDSSDTPPYAVDREVEDIAALITQAGGSAFVFGHSSGAALALEAANSGAAITRLALYEPPFILDDTRPPVPTDYLAHIKGLIAAGKRGETIEYFMTTGVGVPSQMIAGMKQSPEWPAMEALAHTLPYDATIMDGTEDGQPLPTERVAGVRIPTLVMSGGASPEWMRNANQATAEAIPGSEYRILPGQTHGADPKVLAPVLIEFFLR